MKINPKFNFGLIFFKIDKRSLQVNHLILICFCISFKTQLQIKMFLNLYGKVRSMEWQKLAFFVHCFVSERLANQPTTVLELGLSVVLFELNRTIWQFFFCIFVIYFTFLVTSYILLSWNKEHLFLNHHILTEFVA